MTDSADHHVGLQQVVEALQREYGNCLELDYRRGRKQLLAFLRAKFDLKRGEAAQLMEILEENRSLCYMPPIELDEERLRDPRRAAEMLTRPSLRDLSTMALARRSDKAHWCIGE